MMRYLTAIAASLLGLAAMSAAAQTVGYTMDPKLITQIETSVRLPRYADKLDNYVRYYGGVILKVRGPDGKVSSRPVIAGVFISLRSRPQAKGQAVAGVAGVYVLPVGDGFPYFFDGGCELMSVIYDPKAGKFLPSDMSTGRIEPDADARCNGYA
jgi:hypothetical protein